MKLPNAEKARVDKEKIIDYLLSFAHPDGSSKAGFFSRFGFTTENWQTFAKSLRKHGEDNPVISEVESAFGMRYTVEGKLETPDGRNPKVRTVWFIEKGRTEPRFITAYPVR